MRLLFIIICCTALGCGSGRKEAGPTQRTGKDIFRLSHKNTNVYLVRGQGGTALIDAGYEGSFQRIRDFLGEHEIDRGQLDFLILTHAHADHAGSAALIRSEFGCQVIAGIQDSAFYVNGINVDICPTSFTAKILKWFAPGRFVPIVPDQWVGASDTLNVRSCGLVIYNVAGHTPGSLIIKSGHSAFVGDIIRGRPMDGDRPARHYFMCDTDDNDHDIAQLLSDPSIKVWYPGHFGPLNVEDIRQWSEKN